MNILKTVFKFIHLADDPKFREFVGEAFAAAKADYAAFQAAQPLITRIRADITDAEKLYNADASEIAASMKLIADGEALLAQFEEKK